MKYVFAFRSPMGRRMKYSHYTCATGTVISCYYNFNEILHKLMIKKILQNVTLANV